MSLSEEAQQGEPSAVAGSSSGSFSVEQGVASYEISLAIPPGVHGVQPSLALAYNSGQGNGVLGVGFRLQGVSAIARCGSQIVSDSIKGGVSYDDEDQLCLNGQRLIDVGTFEGQPEYRTQVESWQRIVSAGTCGSGPCSFTLYRGDGTTSTFGLHNNSAIHALGPAAGSVRVWMQDTVTDPNGNTMSFYYTQQPNLDGGGVSDQSQSGQGYLDKITYGPSGGSVDSRAIQFLYKEGRQDTILKYLGGGSITTTLLLARIETSIKPEGSSAQQVMGYVLDYGTAPTTARSRLASVTQCTAAGACFNPTKLTWTDGGDSLVSSPTSTPMANNASSYVGDFDGNGLTDIFVQSGSNQNIYFSNGTGFSDGTNTCIEDYLSRFFLGDFDGDGRTDIYAAYSGSNNGILYLGGGVSPGGGTSCCKDNNCPPVSSIDSSDNLLGGDFNGDGRTDLLAYSSNSSTIYLSQGMSFQPSSNGSSGPGLPDETLFPGDYNGDGRADILSISTSGSGNLYYSEETAQDSSAIANTILGSITPVAGLSGQFQWVSDFNNDGLTDMLVGNVPGGGSFISYGTGTGLAAGTTLSIPLSNNSYVGDYNGDGLPDIFIASGSNSTMYLGNGVGFNCVESGTQCTTMDPQVSANASFLGDFNGDGLTDAFTADPSSGTFDWAAVDGAVATENQVADMLISITDGYGGETKITYKPITNPDVYQASDATITGIANLYHPTPLSPILIQSYPIRSLRSGQYVVAQYEQVNDESFNSQDYSYTYCYSYEHGVLNLVGRGWMGYGTITEKDLQLKAQTTTTYRQNFPLNGKVRTQETFALQGPSVTCESDAEAKLQTLSAEWSCFDSQQPQVACTAENVDNDGYTSGDIQVFYVTPASTRIEDEIFGSDVTTQYTFDDWGNLETVAALADNSDAGSVPLYTCKSFIAPDEESWIFKYPQYRKKTNSSDCTENISSWQESSDLQLFYFDYDDHWNKTHRLGWDHQNNLWLGAHLSFTGQGLPESVTEMNGSSIDDLNDIPGTTYNLSYDPEFSSYITSLTTPKPSSGTDPLTLSFAHDARFGVLVARQDPNGNIINHCVDDFGRTAAVQGPPLSQPPQTDSNCVDSGTYPYLDPTFTGNTNLVTTETTNYQYDATEKSVSVVQSGLSSWDQKDWSEVTRVLDGLGRTVQVNYSNDQGTAMTRQTEYLDPSHVLQRSLPGPQTNEWVVYAYDALARIQSTTQPTWDITGKKALTTDTVTYSGQNTLTVTQAAGTPAAFSQKRQIRYYGGQPLVHSAESVGGGTTTIDYDSMGRMTTVTNPESATGDAIVDSVIYDSLGRVTQRADTGTGARQFFYDEHGLLDYEIDPMEQKITFGWDPLHRQTSQQTYVKHGDDYDLESTATITYDVAAGPHYLNPLGRATTASLTRTLPFKATELTYNFGYDPWGRQATQDIAFGGQTFAFDVGYDPQGRPLSRQYPMIGGTRPQANFSYWESYGGLESVEFAADGQHFTNWLKLTKYNALGQPRQAKYGNEVVEHWGHFQNGLPSTHAVIAADQGERLLLDERMGWNPGNQLTTILGHHDSGHSIRPGSSGDLLDNPKTTYSYDLLRLSSIDNDGGGGEGTYCYDNAGNLVQSEGVVFTYTGNQVVTGSEAQTPSQCKSAQGDGVFSAQYDANGNMEWRQVNSTRVDMTTGVEGWLLQTELDGKAFERFAYDYTGQRVMRKVFQDDGVTVDYVVLYPAPDFEVTLTNGGPASATVYLFSGLEKFAVLTGPLPSQEVEQLARELGVTLDAGAPSVPEQALVLHRDQVGSTVAVTDDVGQGYATVSYETWGEPTITPPENDAFRPLFGGKEYTEETDLYYFGARYLDTFTGRFVSADTQVAAGPLVPDSFNDYAYALNNPVLYADPSGHFPVAKVTLGVLAGATAIALGAAGLDVLAAEEIDLTVDFEEGDMGIDEVLKEAEPKPAPDEGTPLLDGSQAAKDGSAGAGQADPAKPEDKTRLGKMKKHAASLGENILQSEAVNLGKYTAMHTRGNWSWKGFGYSSATAVLGGILSFDAGTLADSVAGTGSTDHELIKTLVRGPIQGAASADMGRALNTAFTDSSNQHSWLITSARGAGTGLVLSPMVFGLKMAASRP